MSAAVAILDALRKKPLAEKKKEFSVAFFVANASKSKSKSKEEDREKERDEEKEKEDREKESEEEEPEKRAMGPTVRIVDQASLKLVNREDIFARIKAARGIITEAAPNPLTLTAAKLVSIVEEAPVPKLKGRKLQKIKLIPVSSAPALDKVVLQEAPNEVVEEKEVVNLEPLKQKRGTRKKGDKETKELEKTKEPQTKELAQVPSKKPPQPTKPIEPLVASEYYLNNREKFVEFINKLFQKNFRAEIMDESRVVSCEDRRSAEEFGLLTHQKIVKDYLNMYSPYRGLLLYHGLGSGKTCSSIAIAEGLKSNKRVFVMTPAFLRTNYMQELKKCGDDIYKRPRHWKFVDAVEKPELAPSLAETLDIPEEYVKKHGGAWLVDPEKPSNYGDLSPKEQGEVDAQLNEMIQAKYTFISYNGVRENRINELSLGYTVNPFDNTVVIIDEAHNFVSRIVNHIKKAPDDSAKKGAKGAKDKALKPEDAPIALNLYRFLLDAVNVKVVLLSGTPIINYPNEIGVLFNILRGYIKTWTLQLASSAQGISEARLQQLFQSVDVMDYMKYNATERTLTVTRNPYGFVNVHKVLAKSAVKAQLDKLYNGVTFAVDEHGSINDDDFIKLITATLAAEGIKATKSAANPVAHKALPDTFDGFEKYFIDADTAELKNMDVFKRRILGLTSYYRSAQEQLLPRYDIANDFEVVRVPMSNYQLSVYQQERLVEINKDREANKRKMLAPGRKPRAEGATGAAVGKKPMTMKELYSEPSSSYRIFSRAACNFVFPRELGRPKPFISASAAPSAAEGAISAAEDVDEDIIDADNARAITKNPEGALGVDEAAELQKKTATEAYKQYEDRIEEVLGMLKRNEEQYFNPRALAIYSPKFLKLLQNLQDPKHEGLNLVYSQFRTLEGIGLLKMAMEANDYAQFRIKHNKASNQWVLDNRPEDAGKRRFALYTGKEDAEEKEIIRCIFNSEWDQVPSNIRDELLRISGNNFYGEVINTLMISASGAEGINLRNVRYVHIVEPYWHPVRIEQVVGRARRICSHQDLPAELRTVNVFLYLMVYSQAQLKPLTKDEKAAADQEEALLASSDPKTVVDVSNAALKYIRVSRELRESDTSTKTGQPITTDESLYEIAKTKEAINSNILRCVKETAIDCSIHAKAGSKETLKCFTFDNPENKFAYTPNIQDEATATEEQGKKRATNKPKPAATAAAAVAEAVPLNKEMRKIKIKEITHDGVKYGIDIETNDVYDYENLKIGNRVLVGKFVEMKPGKFTIV
jgi:hypothetical protein